MKRFLLLLMACATMFASCQKDADLAMDADGGMVDVTVSATMEGASATTRAIDSYGTGAKVDRCIMEVYIGDDLYKRMVAVPATAADGSTTRDVTFNLRLVADKTYDFLFWADDSNGFSGTSESYGNYDYDYTDAVATEKDYDNYYDTNNGLKAITADYENYAGNDESRDAFFANKLGVKIESSVVLDEIYLTRPFGQLNVLTYLTDVPTTMYPQSVKIESSTPLADTFDVSDGSTSTSSGATDNFFSWIDAVQSIHYTDSTDDETNPMHLSTDYIFAPSYDESSAVKQQLVDFEMTFYSDDAGTKEINTNSNFKSIPIQRNYRTNVSGDLLTKQGTINVTIKPAFETDDIDQTTHEVATIAEAEAILAAASEESVYIKITEEINSAAYLNLDTSEDFDTSASATSIAATVENITLDFTNVTTDAAIYIGKNLKSDSCGNTGNANESDYAEDLNIILSSENVTIASLNVYTPKAHVEYVEGSVTSANVISSASTFVIHAAASIGTLTVDGGNVEVHGTVGDETDGNDGIIISATNTTTTSIDVYDGGTLYNANPANDSSFSQSITITSYDSGEVKAADSSFTIVAAVSEGATAESVSSTFTSFLSSTTTSTLTLTEDITLSGNTVYTATNIDKTIITSGQIILDGTTTLTNVNVNYTGTETFIVPAGATINTLTITSGNVEIYGTVGVVEVADDNQVEVTITIYDGGTITTEIDDPKFTIAIPTTVSAYNDLLTALSGSYTEITLAGNIDLDSNALSIDRAVTINGAGFSISGGLFTVDSSDVVIEDLTITDMSGYAVTLSEDASLSATNLTTSGNASGGVYLSASSSSFTLVSGTIGDAPQIVLADTSASVTTPSGETWYSGFYDFSEDGTNVKYIYSQTEFDYYTELVGTGTSDDPYMITLVSQLETLATNVNKGLSQSGVYYKLVNDIDLGCDEDNQWTPIGNTTVKTFKGTFDGGGHTISGLYINATTYYQALFGYLSSATVKNLIVEGSVKNTIESSGMSSHVAGIAVYNTSATIINCINRVTVDGSNTYAGGITSNNSGTIVNCANFGSVTIKSYVGGIAGFNTKGTIHNCFNAGKLVKTTSYLGSIAGFQDYNTTNVISDCYYDKSFSTASCGMTVGGTVSATGMTTALMQVQDFVDTLNDNVKAYNDANPTEKACGWKLVDGDYPTLDFNYFPISE